MTPLLQRRSPRGSSANGAARWAWNPPGSSSWKATRPTPCKPAYAASTGMPGRISRAWKPPPQTGTGSIVRSLPCLHAPSPSSPRIPTVSAAGSKRDGTPYGRQLPGKSSARKASVSFPRLWDPSAGSLLSIPAPAIITSAWGGASESDGRKYCGKWTGRPGRSKPRCFRNTACRFAFHGRTAGRRMHTAEWPRTPTA